MPVLYHISEHQTAVPEVTPTPQSGGVFRAGGNYRCPSVAPVPKSFGVTESRLRADDTLSHRYTFNLFILNSLCLFVFLSCSLTLTHVSTDPQVMTSHLQQLRTKRWRVSQGGEWQFYSADAESLRAVPLHRRDVSILSAP